MLRACDADVVGLQEIGSAALLERVLDLPRRPRRLHRSMSARPMRAGSAARCCRGFRSARRASTRAAALPFPVFRDGDPPPFGGPHPAEARRGARPREAPGLGQVDVLVAHFKSARPCFARDARGEAAPTTSRVRRGDLRSQLWRAARPSSCAGASTTCSPPTGRADCRRGGPQRRARLPDRPGVRGSAASEGALLDCVGQHPARGQVQHPARRPKDADRPRRWRRRRSTRASHRLASSTSRCASTIRFIPCRIRARIQGRGADRRLGSRGAWSFGSAKLA